MVSWISVSLVICSVSAIAGRAGEITVEDMSVTRVNVDIKSVTVHFQAMRQFSGFFGSAGESQVTLVVLVLKCSKDEGVLDLRGLDPALRLLSSRLKLLWQHLLKGSHYL